MQPVVIFGSLPPGEGAAAHIPAGCRILAVDKGWQHAEGLGLAPELVLGDFDSAAPPDRGQVQRTAAEKDDTDTMLAVKQAVEWGAREVLLLGCLGGRFDHSYANTQALLYLARQGIPAGLYAPGCEILCRGPGELHLPRRENAYLSVFALGGAAKGVDLEGVRYPLRDATLLPDQPLGVSNEFAAAQAHIGHREGYLLVMIVEKD